MWLLIAKKEKKKLDWNFGGGWIKIFRHYRTPYLIFSAFAVSTLL